MLFCFSYLYILPASASPYFSTAQLLPLRLPSPGLFCDKTNPSSPWLYLQGCALSELRAVVFFSWSHRDAQSPGAKQHPSEDRLPGVVGVCGNWVKHLFAFGAFV